MISAKLRATGWGFNHSSPTERTGSRVPLLLTGATLSLFDATGTLAVGANAIQTEESSTSRHNQRLALPGSIILGIGVLALTLGVVHFALRRRKQKR